MAHRSARPAEARAYHPPTMADQLSLPLDATVDRLPDLPDLRPMLPRPLFFSVPVSQPLRSVSTIR